MQTAASTKFVNCPHCQRPVPWVPAQMFRPFCSERCRLIDLGEWATNQHRIPGEDMLLAEDEDTLC